MYNYGPEYGREIKAICRKYTEMYGKQNLKLAGVKLATEVKHGYPSPKNFVRSMQAIHQSTLKHTQVRQTPRPTFEVLTRDLPLFVHAVSNLTHHKVDSA